jgi:hypothetical protein
VVQVIKNPLFSYLPPLGEHEVSSSTHIIHHKLYICFVVFVCQAFSIVMFCFSLTTSTFVHIHVYTHQLHYYNRSFQHQIKFHSASNPYQRLAALVKLFSESLVSLSSPDLLRVESQAQPSVLELRRISHTIPFHVE